MIPWILLTEKTMKYWMAKFQSSINIISNYNVTIIEINHLTVTLR